MIQPVNGKSKTNGIGKEGDETMKNEQSKKQTSHKKKIIVSLSFVILIGAAIFVGAKYIKDVVIGTQMDTTNIAAYHLNLTTQQVTEIPMENLNPGMKVSIPFTVSNGSGAGDLAKRSEVDLAYQLCVITTNHLPLTYSIKDKDGNQVSSPIKENAVRVYSNLGTKWIFQKDASGHNFLFPKGDLVEENYTIEIEWPLSENAFKYTKEVDQIFIAVEAVQAQPQ
ncbi:hypothetical protein [Anaerosporobacter faecicola]|uniref:hypothetical protein n=1 Tax=Anaerosporobacter faecicola TaxID=2718714 RepID=UPI00143A7E68|nr:hypothetical protein [Anaerosporobacter faecicola]